MKVSIIGTTAWGTALGVMLGRRRISVALWARTAEEAERLNTERENKLRLPGIPLPDSVRPTSSMDEALHDASLIILAVPSQQMRDNARLLRRCIDRDPPVVSAAKGLEKDTAKRMSQVIAEELGSAFHANICAISGPNFSREIARGLPAATVLAAGNGTVAGRVKEIMDSPGFQVETSADLIGVEMAGALKNIIALGAGMMDALGYGDNAKAAFATRGLAEITRLSVAAGADPATLSGLAGVGDLVATCSSPLSRNRTFGLELARGRPVEEIKATMTSVVEGIATTAAAVKLASELRVPIPITEKIYAILYQGYDLAAAVRQLVSGQRV